MSQFYEYNFSSVSKTTELSPLQVILLNQKMDLTKTKYWDGLQVDIIKYGSVREICLTSATDLRGVIFKITGRQNTKFITENINGPNANATVISINVFDTISDITPISGIIPANTSVSVGMNTIGTLPLIMVNSSRNTGLIPVSETFGLV